MYKIFSTGCSIGREPNYKSLVPLIYAGKNDAAKCCMSLDREGYTVWKVITPNGHAIERDKLARAIEAGNGAVRAMLD